MDAGLNSSDAKEFGDAHEYGTSNDSKAKTMDLYNIITLLGTIWAMKPLLTDGVKRNFYIKL